MLKALIDDKLDVIATDHAPHTLKEKQNTYFNAPSGPLVCSMRFLPCWNFITKKISLQKIVEKMCHNPAICFNIENRGFIREGYFADLVIIDLDSTWEVNKENILYKCQWSPFEGEIFNTKICYTLVNGHVAYKYGLFDETQNGMRLTFNR